MAIIIHEIEHDAVPDAPAVPTNSTGAQSGAATPAPTDKSHSVMRQLRLQAARSARLWAD